MYPVHKRPLSIVHFSSEKARLPSRNVMTKTATKATTPYRPVISPVALSTRAISIPVDQIKNRWKTVDVAIRPACTERTAQRHSRFTGCFEVLAWTFSTTGACNPTAMNCSAAIDRTRTTCARSASRNPSMRTLSATAPTLSAYQTWRRLDAVTSIFDRDFALVGGHGPLGTHLCRRRRRASRSGPGLGRRSRSEASRSHPVITTLACADLKAHRDHSVPNRTL